MQSLAGAATIDTEVWAKLHTLGASMGISAIYFLLIVHAWPFPEANSAFYRP